MSRLARNTLSFIRRVSRFRNCCLRIEKQFYSGGLRVTDVELVYASSFLSVCCLWESFLEATLFEAVCGEESNKSGNIRLATFKNRKHLSDLLLFPGKDYISIPNLKRAEELASLFVTKGRPFSSIGERYRSLIQQAVLIRNAIAHQSPFSLQEFRHKIPGVAALPRQKRTPGPFLRHQFRISPSQRRYELYFAAFQSAANEIAQSW